MRYRVDELADRCGVSVDTIRYYQTRGLLPPPQRQGRHAVYDDAHVERLDAIRSLKERGYSLALIARTLEGELDPAEEALAGALVAADAAAAQDSSDGDTFTREQLAERADVPPSLLEALEREGLLVPRTDAEAPYDNNDLAAVHAGRTLLEAGLPLSELLALAREHDEAVRSVADQAVELFARFVRDPALGTDDEHAGEQVVAALRSALPAAGAVVAYHFERRVLAAARARLEGGQPVDEDSSGPGQGADGAPPPAG